MPFPAAAAPGWHGADPSFLFQFTPKNREEKWLTGVPRYGTRPHLHLSPAALFFFPTTPDSSFNANGM